MRGKFITLEGGEGAGKSTQARLLADALEQRGLEVVLTREPGGTAGAEAIRRLLLDPAGEGWYTPAEALLFAAARADHVARRIAPALAQGAWVVCDRFLDSSRAYQAGHGEAGGEDNNWSERQGEGLRDADILALHRIGSAGLLPDLTLLLAVSPATLGQRLTARDGGSSDRIGGRDAAYHAAVAARFEALAGREPERFARIDGENDPVAVHARVLKAVERLLERAP